MGSTLHLDISSLEEALTEALKDLAHSNKPYTKDLKYCRYLTYKETNNTDEFAFIDQIAQAEQIDQIAQIAQASYAFNLQCLSTFGTTLGVVALAIGIIAICIPLAIPIAVASTLIVAGSLALGASIYGFHRAYKLAPDTNIEPSLKLKEQSP